MCGAIWSAAATAADLRQVDPLIRQLTLYRDFIESKTKESEMNLIELERALRQLRLGGMATVLETRCARRSPKPWRLSI